MILIFIVVEIYPKTVFGEYIWRTIGPFDDANAFPEKLLVQSQIPSFSGASHTVEVHMVEGQSTLMPGHQNESRTTHVSFNSQTQCYPLGKARLSSAQWPGQQKRVPGLGILSNDAAQVLSEFGSR